MIDDLVRRQIAAKFVIDAVISGNPTTDREMLETPAFWEECIDFAMRIHALSPFCSVVLQQTWIHSVDEGSLLRLNERMTRERMLLAIIDQELDEALFQLINAQVPVSVLKGADLSRRYYPSRALRPMADVDILVRPEQFRDALRVLGRAGYRAVGPLPEGRFRVELARQRTESFQSPTVEIHRQLLEGDSESHTLRIWERTLEGVIPGLPRAVRALRADDNLIYLIRHAAVQHAIESPIWMNDIHWVIEKESTAGTLDWDQVLWRLAQERALSAGFVVFQLLSREWGTHIPDTVLSGASRRLGWFKRGLLSPLARTKNLFPAEGRGMPWLVRSRILLRDRLSDAWKYGVARMNAGP